MKLRIKKTLAVITMIVPAFLIAGGGVAKIIAVPAVVHMLSAAGVGLYIPFLGAMEIAFVILFVIPRTRRLGFLLLCCYFGGAIATVISHEGKFPNPAVLPLVLICINMLLRDKEIFLV